MSADQAPDAYELRKSGPSPEAPSSFSRRAPEAALPPLSTSTGSTTAACTAPAATSHPSSSKISTTVRSPPSAPRSRHDRASTEPGRFTRRRGPPSGAGRRSPTAPSAARRGTAWRAARRPGWCPGARHDRTRSTGSGKPNEQHRRPPPERLVRRLAGDTVAHQDFTAAPLAPPIRLDDPASQHRPVGLDPLRDDLKTEPIEAAERSQVRGARR